MKKIHSLRAYLSAAMPELAQDAERLQVFVDRGSIRATGAGEAGAPISLEYRYTCRVVLIDFAGDVRAVSVVLVSWLAVNQPELLQNFTRNRQGLPFEVDILDAGKVDLQFDLELTDGVVATATAEDRLDIEDVAEPVIAGTARTGAEAQAQMIVGDIWPPQPFAPTILRRLYADGVLVAELPADG